MKLLNKTSIYYLLFALPVFAICSGLLYYFVSSQIISSLDESLVKEKTTIENNLKKGQSILDLDEEVNLKEISSKTISAQNIFTDTTLYDSEEKEVIPYRLLKANVTDGTKNYEITIRTSHIESDDLIKSILEPVIILFVGLLVGFFLINFFVSKKLWKPFYKTLEQLNNFKIAETSVAFDVTTVHEFSKLNKVLTTMTEQIHSDYISQKQFIENASHEIQTPLAVIKSKIELLIQSSSISENDMHIIQSAYNATNKLSSLNKALLLLSKIENNQFKESEEISFNAHIDKTLLHFEDIIILKNISINKEYKSELKHKMNAALADILITNLIQNAIRHNIKDGSITIQLTENVVVISNTGNASVTNTAELFQRFRKSEGSSESIGLGLAIVKEICEKYKIEIKYTCFQHIHSVELTYSKRLY